MAVEATGNFPTVMSTIEQTLAIARKVTVVGAITRRFPLPELAGALEETMRDGKILVKPERG